MKAIIHLMPSSLRREFIFLEDGKVAGLVERFDAGVFEKKNAIEVAPWTVGHQEAAKAMFDLTNDPSLQPEREKLYGTGRSVSVGDIVEVAPDVGGHSYWLCMTFGWKEIF